MNSNNRLFDVKGKNSFLEGFLNHFQLRQAKIKFRIFLRCFCVYKQSKILIQTSQNKLNFNSDTPSLTRTNMNLESYKSCIQSLEKEIQCRENERVSMQKQISNMDQELSRQYQRYNTLKRQFQELKNSHETLVIQLQQKDSLIVQKQSLLSTNQSADSQLRKRLSFLEGQKTRFEGLLKLKQTQLNEKNARIRELDSEHRKDLSLIDGYKNIVKDKAEEISRQLSRMRSLELQKQKISEKLMSIQQEYERNKETIFLMSQGQSSAAQKIKQLEEKNMQTQRCLKEEKQSYSKRLQALQEKHKRQLEEQKEKKENLLRELKQELQEKEREKQAIKDEYQVHASNKDDMVTNLINEINFLKEEKSQLEKKSSHSQQQRARQILKLATEHLVTQSKLKTQTQQIAKFQEQLQSIKKQNQSLLLQQQAQIKKILQQNRTLQTEIKQQRSQLIRLRSESSQSSYSKNHLEKSIKTHEETIINLTNLLEQQKKLNKEFNQLMGIKIKELQTLEENNRFLRMQKIEFIQRETQYRKKIVQLRNLGSNKSLRDFKGSAKQIMDFVRSQRKISSNIQTSAFASHRTKTLMDQFAQRKPNTARLKYSDVLSEDESEQVQFQLPPQSQLPYNHTINGKNPRNQGEQERMKKKDKKWQAFNNDLSGIQKNESQFEQSEADRGQGRLKSSMSGINNLLEKLDHKEL